MRIVLDLQGAQTPGSRRRGIGRYATALARAMAREASFDIDLRITFNANFAEAGEAVEAELADDPPRTAFSYYQALPGTYPPPVESDPVQRVNSEIVRAHYASLQPDAVVTASVMEGFLLGDHCPAPPGLPGVVEAAVLYDLIPLVLAGDFLPTPSTRPSTGDR